MDEQIGTELADEGAVERFDIADERAQKVMDHRELYERLGQARQFLAQAKVNRVLATAGLLEKGEGRHPNQYRDAIVMARNTVDTLTAAISSLGEHGLAEGASLEVATTVPAVGDVM